MTNTKRDLTFKHNQGLGRHGWLRLTPAYSVKVVHQLLDSLSYVSHILDPFSGTGTTGLASAERGLRCDLTDINPFLVWFAQTKTVNYASSDLEQARAAAGQIRHLTVTNHADNHIWVPPIYNIHRWWSERELNLLALIYQEIQQCFPTETASKNLLLIAFCRLVIEASNAAFNHQSMSFKNGEIQPALWDNQREDELLQRFNELVSNIVQSSQHPIPGYVRVIQADARQLPVPQEDLYDCVITSPPYPNRMSYIRELRPYMYWLGYLKEAREAAELDWKAIGGTWGVATSRLKDWHPDGVRLQYSELDTLIAEIAQSSSLLANYVHKYFVDVSQHLSSLTQVLAPGARVFYIVGNSKFYNTLVPVERIYAHLLSEVGFVNIKIERLRKRNSKAELYEYVVSATKSF
jgi:hypothetical protein